MSSLERHRDAGAYALGVLDPADTSRFEEHLPDCPTCLLACHELNNLTRQMKLYARVTPTAVEPFAVPSAGLLDRLLRQVRIRFR
ncbi:zf-HC2 domain-containing protein [Streptomyces sp. NPDC058308]|uniref:zf-HC2 domain-containing protein n=1 Tax=Streptomyces sp. NPDC058308 TaxID=3346440 RepID=UPI0036ED5801